MVHADRLAGAGPGGLPLGHERRVGHDGGRGGQVLAELLAVAKGVGKLHERVCANFVCHLAKDDVGGHGKGLLQADGAVALVGIVGDRCVADVHGAGRLVGAGKAGGTGLECRGKRNDLKRGARRVQRVHGAIVHRAVLAAARLQQGVDVGVVVGGRAGACEHRAGTRIDDYYSALKALERLLGRRLDTRVDGELGGVARLGLARERRDGVVPAGVILRAGERVVHDALDGSGAILLAHVANHVRCQVTVGVGAYVGAVLLLQRLGQRHAIGRDDGTALDVLGAGDGVVVGRHVLIVLGLDDLDIGEVADKDGEQRRKGEHRTG